MNRKKLDPDVSVIGWRSVCWVKQGATVSGIETPGLRTRGNCFGCQLRGDCVGDAVGKPPASVKKWALLRRVAKMAFAQLRKRRAAIHKGAALAV